MSNAVGLNPTFSQPSRRKSQSSTHSVHSHLRVGRSFRRRSSDPGGSSSEHDPTDTVPHVSKSIDKTLSGDAFKKAILSLLHQLAVSQWRSVPIEFAQLVSVRRIYGALTNSIYQITLPDDIEKFIGCKGLFPRAAPKLLLRIYGAHVEQLIDRTHELAMLKRLSKHNIGPLLLGTFTNGRFEQWLDSHTLSRLELRDPNLSCSIARRMRELHDGVKLTYSERHSSPTVWTSLDKWLPRAREIIAHRRRKLTGRLSDKNLPTLTKLGETKKSCVIADSWSNDLILGQKWAMFELAVGRYRLYMEERYPPEKLKHDLAFCHNDVHYHSTPTDILRRITATFFASKIKHNLPTQIKGIGNSLSLTLSTLRQIHVHTISQITSASGCIIIIPTLLSLRIPTSILMPLSDHVFSKHMLLTGERSMGRKRRQLLHLSGKSETGEWLIMHSGVLGALS